MISKTRHKLAQGEPVMVDDIVLIKETGPIVPGCFYVAERNTGPVLLICRVVDTDLDAVFPDGEGYPYRPVECIRVKECR